jgi:hypothetical protein
MIEKMRDAIGALNSHVGASQWLGLKDSALERCPKKSLL